MLAAIATPTRLRSDTMELIQQEFERVQDRLRRATTALEDARQEYAVIGGNAVIHWVTQVRPTAFRFTQAVDILVRRDDLPAIKSAMTAAGFIYRHAAGIDFFLDGPKSTFDQAVHVVFAGEKVRKEYLLPAADVAESVPGKNYHVISLEALVRMKLTSLRLKDATHLDDLLRVGLIDETWLSRFPSELAARLQQVIDQFEPLSPELSNLNLDSDE